MKFPPLKLNDQAQIPALGFGTWQLKDEDCERGLEAALEVGYKHIDTAKAYDNHKTIGKVLKTSGIDRKELFITSKLWITDFKHDDAVAAGKEALDELGIDYLDLYLIHWPDRKTPFAETLGALNKLKEQGLIKALGVSNFTINHIKDALETGVEITNNQVEYHPSLNQENLRKFCNKNEIQVTAYSPIAQGDDFAIPDVQELSRKYDRSPAQIILNWILNKGMIAIPRSANPEHIKDNFNSQEFALEPEDTEKLNKVNEDYRVVNPSFGDFDY